MNEGKFDQRFSDIQSAEDRRAKRRRGLDYDDIENNRQNIRLVRKWKMKTQKLKDKYKEIADTIRDYNELVGRNGYDEQLKLKEVNVGPKPTDSIENLMKDNNDSFMDCSYNDLRVSLTLDWNYKKEDECENIRLSFHRNDDTVDAIITIPGDQMDTRQVFKMPDDVDDYVSSWTSYLDVKDLINGNEVIIDYAMKGLLEMENAVDDEIEKRLNEIEKKYIRRQ